MRVIVGLAVGFGMLALAGPVAAQCDPWVCTNPYASWSAARVQTRCPTDVVVWQEGRAPIYHLKGSPKFGRTPTGAFMCKARAVLHGSRPAKERATGR